MTAFIDSTAVYKRIPKRPDEPVATVKGGLKVLRLCIFLLKLNQRVCSPKRFLALYCVLSRLLHKQVSIQPLPSKSFEMLITKTFMLLTGVFTFSMLEGGMCLFFSLFWCPTLFVYFTATQTKNVIPTNEARLVWPSSPNDPSFTFLIFFSYGTDHKKMFLQTCFES